MTLVPTCPRCFGLILLPVHRHYDLKSACRCGYPESVTWDDFPAQRRAQAEADEAAAAEARDRLERLRSKVRRVA